MKLRKNFGRFMRLWSKIVLGVCIIGGATLGNHELYLAQTSDVVPEGDDFATRILQDAWDMSEFTDISVGLNNSGQNIYLNPVTAEDGLFVSTSVYDAQFFPLWPMFSIGKVGDQYPISSNQFRCLYVALKVSGQNEHPVQAFWFADDRLNTGVWGYTVFKTIPNREWFLVKFELQNDFGGGTNKWLDYSEWKGLRIDPTNESGAVIEVDWIRLTECSNVIFTINGLSPNKNYGLYLYSQGREIKIQDSRSNQSGFVSLDVQGVAPGTYEYRVREMGTLVKAGQIIVNQTPIIKFSRPSPLSGPSISWEMSSSSDVIKLECIYFAQYKDGNLEIRTQSNACASSSSVGDPKIHLNLSVSINGIHYRYLNYRINTAWSKPWANVPKGMIARWIWSTLGTSGRPGSRCHWVSQDFPFDVDWNTYSVDLFDAFLGEPEEKAGECPAINNRWADTNNILELRFDPNENITGEDIIQKLDWIRLSGVERVQKGRPFTVEYYSNKSKSQLTYIDFYYTTNPETNPLQHKAVEYISAPTPPLPPIGTKIIYLPLLLSGNTFSGEVFHWDTSQVNPGEYYICAQLSDSINTAIYCSDAPIQVIGDTS
jgi:hypothetical protein